jgi:hypothetical protein
LLAFVSFEVPVDKLGELLRIGFVVFIVVWE